MTAGRAASLLVLAAVLAGGCSMAAGEGGGSPSPAPSSSPSSAGDAATRAQAALARVGLHLPAGASHVTWQTTTWEPMTDTSLVTFSAPAEAAEALCRGAGMGGLLVATGLTSTQQQALQLTSPPTGSRICGGALPADARWNRHVLIGPGDPAQVRVGIFRMPAR
jgi:hypothetical protein